MKTINTTLLRGTLVLAFLLVAGSLMAQATVSGRCTDKSGVPLKGVQVTAILFDEKKSVESDGDGNYSHKNLSQGNWTIMFVYMGEKMVKKVVVKTTPIDMDVTFNLDSKK